MTIVPPTDKPMTINIIQMPAKLKDLLSVSSLPLLFAANTIAPKENKKPQIYCQSLSEGEEEAQQTYQNSQPKVGD